MPIPLLVFIVIQFIAFLFFGETLRRVWHRVEEFPMEENESTLPFGVIRLRHLVILYIVSYILWVGFSLWLYFTLISPSTGLSVPLLPQGNQY